MDEDPLFGEAVGTEDLAQAFLSEISEEDVEVLRQREEALLQIEVRTLTPVSGVIARYMPPSAQSMLDSGCNDHGEGQGPLRQRHLNVRCSCRQ